MATEDRVDDAPEEKPWFKHYDPGVPREIEVPDKTIPQFYRETAARFPQTEALSFMGTKISYNRLTGLINQFSHALINHTGLPQGSKIAIHLPNCPQFVIAYCGALQAGYTVVPCNPLYVEREMEIQLNDSEAEAIITLTRFYPMISRIKEKTGLKKVVVTSIKEYFPGHLRLLYTLFREKKEGDRVNIAPEDTRWSEFLKGQITERSPQVEPGPDSPACLLYTGGTTGVSKGAVLTHRNLIVNALQTASFMPDYKEGREKGLAVLPFFHSYGLTTLLNLSFVKGGTLVLVPRFDAKMILQLIDKEKPTLFPGVPTLYVALINTPEIQNHDLSSIKVCNSGAAPLPVEVQSRFEDISGGKLVEGYGLTEASPVTHSNPVYGYRKEGSIGVPLPNTTAKIMDIENPDREMPVEESGELAISGPQVMQGYYNLPEETKKTLRGGWLYTGDIAKMDEDGFFYIVDRKKDMVIAGGYNIFPREVEEVLYTHEKIQEVVVAGVPDEYRGETIKAYIVPKEGKELSEEEIKEFCKENMAVYKVPRKIEFREQLPKSMVGKILRRELVEEEKEKSRREEK